MNQKIEKSKRIKRINAPIIWNYENTSNFRTTIETLKTDHNKNTKMRAYKLNVKKQRICQNTYVFTYNFNKKDFRKLQNLFFQKEQNM